MSEFHFLRPEWFWGLLVFLLLPLLVHKRKNHGGLWQKLCDGRLLDFQLVSGTEKSFFLPFLLLAAGWMLSLFALAGPTWKKLPQPAVKKGADTVYALDISVLMTPSDIKPTRMDRARFKMHDLLQKTKDGQNAFLLFDKEPFVAAPLSADSRIIDNMIPTVQAGMMGGNTPDTASAIAKAVDLLAQAKSLDGRIVVLSGYIADDALSEVLQAAEKAKSEGYSVSFLGFGTKQGAPLQLSDGTFLTRAGKPVLSALSEKNMKKAAQAGGGVYRAVTLDETDVDAILNALPEKGSFPVFSDQDETKADTWKDFGAVLCIFVLPFAAFGFRKGWLGIWVIGLLSFPVRAQAWSLSDLWTRPDRKEALAIVAGEKPQNPDVFKDPLWHGAASYKAGDFPSAVSSLADREEADALYNKGNALAQSGEYQQAIEAYTKALEKSPDHEDAAFNKKYLEEQLKNNQQQQQDQQQKQDQQQRQDQLQQQDQQDRQKEDKGQKKQKMKQAEEKEASPQSGQKAPPEQKTKEEQEKQEQMQWLGVIEDDPSGLLRERIRRHNSVKRRRR